MLAVFFCLFWYFSRIALTGIVPRKSIWSNFLSCNLGAALLKSEIVILPIRESEQLNLWPRPSQWPYSWRGSLWSNRRLRGVQTWAYLTNGTSSTEGSQTWKWLWIEMAIHHCPWVRGEHMAGAPAIGDTKFVFYSALASLSFLFNGPLISLNYLSL